MIRRSLCAPCFGLLAFVSSVPPSQAEVRIGLFGGTSSFKWELTPPEGESLEGLRLETRTALAAGLVTDFRFGQHFGVRLEPGFVRKEIRLVFEPGTFLEGNGDVRQDYFDVPVLFSVFLGSGGVRPYLLGGGAAAFLSRATSIDQDGEEEDIKDNLESPEWSVTAGAGLELGSGRTRGFLEARYSWGLTNLIKDSANLEGTAKNRGFFVLAGVTFRLGS